MEPSGRSLVQHAQGPWSDPQHLNQKLHILQLKADRLKERKKTGLISVHGMIVYKEQSQDHLKCLCLITHEFSKIKTQVKSWWYA